MGDPPFGEKSPLKEFLGTWLACDWRLGLMVNSGVARILRKVVLVWQAVCNKNKIMTLLT